ncbi:hypothetical protein ACQR1Q_33045 [Bradyrhizobium oligotrophicum]|uniref:hypothetical protein n=1 Tax=Bradyrhizobium oligotrophicum TaxID=44255 RepID=UPI003EBD6BF9
MAIIMATAIIGAGIAAIGVGVIITGTGAVVGTAVTIGDPRRHVREITATRSLKCRAAMH